MSGQSVTVTDRAREDHSRSPHEYAVDLFIEPWLEGEIDESDAIVVAEKDYFYTTRNTPIEKVKEDVRASPKKVYGSPKGDLDFAVIFLDEQFVKHFEFKESDQIDDPESSNYDRNYTGEEQIQRLAETFQTMEEAGSEWTYEGEVRYLDEEEPSRGHPDNYSDGYWFATEELEQRARSSEAFQNLNEAVFDGRFFWDDEIEEKEIFG